MITKSGDIEINENKLDSSVIIDDLIREKRSEGKYFSNMKEGEYEKLKNTIQQKCSLEGIDSDIASRELENRRNVVLENKKIVNNIFKNRGKLKAFAIKCMNDLNQHTPEDFRFHNFKSDSDDLIQLAFEKSFKNIQVLDEVIRNIDMYLFAVVNSIAKDIIKSKRSKNEVLGGTAEKIKARNIRFSPVERPDETQEGKELHNYLFGGKKRGVKNLFDEIYSYRSDNAKGRHHLDLVMLSMFIQGYEDSEIAEKLKEIEAEQDLDFGYRNLDLDSESDRKKVMNRLAQRRKRLLEKLEKIILVEEN